MQNERSRRGGHLWKLVGVAFSALLMSLAFHDVEMTGLLASIRSAPLRIVAVVVVLNFAVIVLKALRWRTLICLERPLRFSSVFLATLVGYAANTFLPARGGEVVRIMLLARRERTSRAALLGALALDHVLEGIGMLGCLLALPFLMPTPTWLRSATILIAAVVAAALGASILVLRTDAASLIAKLPVNNRARETLRGAASRLSLGLVSLRSPTRLAHVTLHVTVIWLVQAAMVHLCLLATDIRVSPAQSLFILMVVNIAVLVPAGPSNVGTFELSAVLGLAFLGFDNTRALSFALIYHALQLVPTTVGGIIAVPFGGLGFTEIKRAEAPALVTDDPSPRPRTAG